jgi:hypothetical protein
MIVNFVLKVQITYSLRSLLTQFLGQLSTLTLTLNPNPNPKTLTLNNRNFNPNPNPFLDLEGLGPTGIETQRVNPKIVPQLMILTF